MRKKFLALITRHKNEPFLKQFCLYYINQGIDDIYIIDDNSKDKRILKELDFYFKNIHIIYEYDIIRRNLIKDIYQKIRNQFNWIINVDVDEYITTKKHITKTIREEIVSNFNSFDCIKVPWVMMSSNNRKKNPENLLEENIYRWNHNTQHFSQIYKFRCRYEKIECKTIFKTSVFSDISDHMPLKATIESPLYIESVNRKSSDSTMFYQRLREKDIKSGYLLCYHYRIISEENNLEKLINNIWYEGNKYILSDLKNSDYAEVRDLTMAYK
tara:strand:- start:41 stop:853 length:813 start_codon:yes stop_codon:yes gene_type:complete